jgi:integrase
VPKRRSVKKRLADGTIKVYHYDRKKKPEKRFADDTIGALTIEYRHSPEWRALSEATRRTYSVYLRDIELLQTEPVAKITRRSLLKLRDVIAEERGNGASTGFIRTASALFKFAVGREIIDHNPAYSIEALPGGELVPWTIEQVEAAMSLPEPYRRVVVLALYTGQRRGDLIRMRWSDYDGLKIKLVQQKTGSKLTLTAPAELRFELDGWKKDTLSDTILLTERGLPWQPQHISHMLPKALVAIGLPPLGVHGLRKLAASRLANSGCTAHEIAAVTGHKSLSMVQHYTKTADQERLAESAISRLESQPRVNRETNRE